MWAVRDAEMMMIMMVIGSGVVMVCVIGRGGWMFWCVGYMGSGVGPSRPGSNSGLVRQAHNLKVGGSNPLPGLSFSLCVFLNTYLSFARRPAG